MRGIWSSEELKFAKSKGYEITVIKGYQFNKAYDIFNGYINELFNLKKDSNGFLKLIYKSLLNKFLGRFGLNLIKPITHTVSKDRRDYIFSTRNVHTFMTHTILNENKILITYTPTISKEICMQHGLDNIKVLEKESRLNIESNLGLFKDVSIATAAMVTSYARIYMSQFKNSIYELYYSDTDSLFIRGKLSKELIGKELGQFKLEYILKEAVFLGPKLYACLLARFYHG